MILAFLGGMYAGAILIVILAFILANGGKRDD